MINQPDLNRQQLEPLIRVENLSFDYEKKAGSSLIDDVSFSLLQGEVTLLLGASGSGKSTISLCLNGLYPEAVEGYKKGDVFFRGREIRQFEKGELNQKIGIVFQDPESQFCMMTVENELAFTMENIRIPQKDMSSKIDRILEAVGLKDFQKRPIHQLSGGQKQKVALASVLLLEPELLILDEPTANLDPVSSMEFIKLVSELQKERGMSVFVIEHQLDDWVLFTDHVLALSQEGKLIADGRPDLVFKEQLAMLGAEGIHLPKDITKFPAEKHKRLADKAPRFLERTISISHLSFKRKGNVILDEIDLALHKGEFVAIVGENGAGKSTLLQLMAGILTPYKGKIDFLNKSLKQWREQELRQKMGFVFQNPEHQFITDTVYDELAFGMKLNGTGERKMKARIDVLLDHFQLQNHQWSNPFSISGGQKRRLSVATMLDETPELLLFDEPTFGQDAKTTEELMTIILELKEQGTTVVFVTHDMDLVDQYCERTFVLDSGRIVFHGHPEKLWKNEELLHTARLRQPYRIRKQNLKQQKAGETYDLVR
ncbi:ABC transporter ATP-binding protein [Salipaludibacillus daqingensis]|uniref:ABC transporter ATP-binding protein n=1 Tax=Salipaludibacillus daqingensis TaxID=3041001 RepID=UPI002473E72A|nr:energy-coupling factor transporter ATPase [Salipaludibacillus daqingensis]